MAICHCSIKIISRRKGKSAVTAAAYRSGEKLINDYDGATHDYTRKSVISHTEILMPAHAPPKDMPAVQEERSNFRDTMKSLWTKIQQQYGYRSNYDLLKAAKDEVDMELGEYHPHIRKSILKDLEQKHQQTIEQHGRRKRRDKWER